VDQTSYYSQLEQGARYLASISADAAERRTHLGWANHYYRLRLEARFEADPEQRKAA
jgi:hypothetical protein